MAQRKGGKQPNELPYSERIAQRVRELAPTCSVKDIVSSISHMQYAPGSYTTFYKLYRKDLDEAKGNITKQIGDKLINTAINGDEDSPFTHKSREFYLDRQGGWNKKTVEETREVGPEEEENESAVNALLAALGKGIDEEDATEGV